MKLAYLGAADQLVSGFRLDIERGAKLSNREGAKSGPRISKWSPHPRGEDDGGEE